MTSFSQQHLELHRGQRDYRAAVATCAAVAIVYSITVLWYVATCPDIGLRCLLPEELSGDVKQGLPIVEFVGPGISPAPAAGDRLLSINRQPVDTFLDFVQRVNELRFASISPGGQLPPGSDPLELKSVPGLVEIYSTDDSVPPQRFVELRFLRAGSTTPDLPQAAWIPLRPVAVVDITLTLVWFGCQLSILAFGLAAYWQRPFDRVARNFCLMSCAAMGAFVAGFHWWILAGNPLLNLPFILSAAMLPSLVLYFFLIFPREAEMLRSRRRLVQWLVFTPGALSCLLLIVVYWSAWTVNPGPAQQQSLSFLQKSVVLTRMVLGGAMPLELSDLSTWTLALLRYVIHSSIALASIYFFLTVVQLGISLVRIQSPMERRQALVILVAALVSTIPISYALYLAIFRKLEFALGQAQIPMFVASMMFMAAYGHGMLRHRLILVDRSIDRARRYWLVSVIVSGGFAMCLGIGGLAAHSYSLPLNPGIAQQTALFLILGLAAALGLWVRDRLQSAVDRRFFSEKYQLDRTIQQLNRAAGYLTDPSGMAEITVRTCQDIVDASWAAMFVRDGHGSFRLIGASSGSAPPAQLRQQDVQGMLAEDVVVSRQASSNRESMTPLQALLHDLRAELACALQDEGGLHGLVLVGRRASGAAYTAEDVAFLQAIAQMSVLALHSARANQDLARLDAEMKVKVDRIAEQQRQMALLRAELTSLQQEAGQSAATPAIRDIERDEIRGNSVALLDVLSQIGKVAASSATVLVRGESGTGKELLARVIHRNSERKAAPLVSVNCAALAPSLLESELFGHVRGAFTGAHADKAGRFLAANGGTLFLDEIGDISLETQVKLLRVLQERKFEPVGCDETIEIDVRLIAATNRDLEQMMEQGQFRQDLYYRLNVVSLTLPPLRERADDLVDLVFYFLSRAGQRARKQIRQIDPAALAALERHAWPGNIRELENVIERAVVLAESDVVTLSDLPPIIRQRSTTAEAAATKPVPIPGRNQVDHYQPPAAAIARSSSPVESLDPEAEEQMLRDSLRRANGNKARAARSLNLPRSTFFSKCRKYGIS